jgi:opacity protein-like surface antigen
MNKTAIAIMSAIAAALCFYIAGYDVGYKHGSATTPINDTIVVNDTIRITQPQVIDSTIIKYIKVPVPQPTETAVLLDTIIDSVYVELPIVQKHYADSTYEAWISGFEARLDSINVFRRETIMRSTETRKIAKKWGLGVQAGVGATKDKWSPYIGVGISYNLWTW